MLCFSILNAINFVNASELGRDDGRTSITTTTCAQEEDDSAAGGSSGLREPKGGGVQCVKLSILFLSRLSPCRFFSLHILRLSSPGSPRSGVRGAVARLVAVAADVVKRVVASRFQCKQ